MMCRARDGVVAVALAGLSGVGCSPPEAPVAEVRTASASAPATSEPALRPAAAAVATEAAVVSSAPLPSVAPASAAPATAPEVASAAPSAAPSASPPAPALGPFRLADLPKTKLALIEAVDAALRQRSAELLGELWLDDSLFDRLCPAIDAEGRARMAVEQRQRRQEAAEAFQACLELADWSQSRRLALNYGSRVERLDGACLPGLREHEDSELFYVLDDTVLKVKIFDAVSFGGWHALARRIRCSKKKPGSATEAEAFMRRIPKSCPQVPWPALTQIRSGCPPL